MNVLVVDDEKAMREVVTRRLAASGHTVRAASDAGTALRELDRLGAVDVVITDIYMPGRTGVELLQSIKQRDPQVEVILMTAYAEVDSAASAVESDAFAYLRKPFTMAELGNVVGRACEHRALQRDRAAREQELEELVAKLRASEDRYKTLVEGVPGAVIATDRELVITSASERCRAVLGYAPSDLVGRPISTLRPPGAGEDLETRANEVLTRGTGAEQVSGRVLTPAGNKLHTVEVITPFGEDANGSRPSGVFWIIQDVSAAHKLTVEAELAREYLDAIRRSRSKGRRIVGESAPIKALLRMIRSAAPTRAAVLICGETGTGKGLVAESLHINSPRAHKPFVVVNCAALPETLLESELFGYQKGAFTGADRDKRGLVAVADGATLFVDEVAEMSPAVQAKLLQVLDRGQFRPLGSTEDRSTDIRVIAATSRDLAKGVRAGWFREDLLYRLDVIHIDLPPLRELREDIPLIAEHLLEHGLSAARGPKTIAQNALDALMAYSWPGNVRELSNVLERAAILAAEEPEITIGHLSVVPTGTSGPVRPLREVEEREIDRALALTKGNKTRAARLLGISRQTLISRLKRRTHTPPGQ